MRPPCSGIRCLAAAVALAALACLVTATTGAAGERERDEPRLILPGDRAVEPGEWIVLQWTPADSVRELELLLSLDGGRTWPLCLSPPLDPERCAFRWQVPSTRARDLRIRIRYNRGGREIEGAPSGPLWVTGHDRGQPMPLSLPPVDPSDTRPRPSNDGRRDASPGAARTTRLARPRLAATLAVPDAASRGLDASLRPVSTAGDAGPTHVPMRS